MTSVLRSTVAPLVYVVAAVLLFLSVKALRRVGGAGTARRCGGAGLLLAAAGGILEAGLPDWIVLAALLAGLATGGLLGSRLPLVGLPWRWRSARWHGNSWMRPAPALRLPRRRWASWPWALGSR